MKYNIESRQAKNGEWKVYVKGNMPYYERTALERRVKEVMEENGFPIFKLMGVDA